MRQRPADPNKHHQARLLAGDLFREPKRTRSALTRALLLVGGVLAILAGVALVVLPVVPGFPLVIIGVLMVAAASGLVRRLLNRLERRLPTQVRARMRRLARRERTVFEERVHGAAESPGTAPPAPDRAR